MDQPGTAQRAASQRAFLRKTDPVPAWKALGAAVRQAPRTHTYPHPPHSQSPLASWPRGCTLWLSLKGRPREALLEVGRGGRTWGGRGSPSAWATGHMRGCPWSRHPDTEASSGQKMTCSQRPLGLQMVRKRLSWQRGRGWSRAPRTRSLLDRGSQPTKGGEAPPIWGLARGRRASCVGGLWGAQWAGSLPSPVPSHHNPVCFGAVASQYRREAKGGQEGTPQPC